MTKVRYQRHRASLSLPLNVEVCGFKDKVLWLHSQNPEPNLGSATFTTLSLDFLIYEMGVITGSLRGLNPLVQLCVVQSKCPINVRSYYDRCVTGAPFNKTYSR